MEEDLPPKPKPSAIVLDSGMNARAARNKSKLKCAEEPDGQLVGEEMEVSVDKLEGPGGPEEAGQLPAGPGELELGGS
jgi:hypothetical protein